MQKNLILDFTGVYADALNVSEEITYIDCMDIPETDMYCSKSAEQEIKRRIQEYGASGIHFLDSGNYHYVTKFFTDEIKTRFSLILFDFHDDMQQSMIHDLTSCGSWARDILLHNTYLEQLVIIGPDKKNLENLAMEHAEKLVCISVQELEEHLAGLKLRQIKRDVPFYISIDKDVLSKSYAVTNWNQGQLSITMLERLLKIFFVDCNVIGVDICGEYSAAGGKLPEYYEAERINRKTDQVLYEYIRANLPQGKIR